MANVSHKLYTIESNLLFQHGITVQEVIPPGRSVPFPALDLGTDSKGQRQIVLMPLQKPQMADFNMHDPEQHPVVIINGTFNPDHSITDETRLKANLPDAPVLADATGVAHFPEAGAIIFIKVFADATYMIGGDLGWTLKSTIKDYVIKNKARQIMEANQELMGRPSSYALEGEALAMINKFWPEAKGTPQQLLMNFFEPYNVPLLRERILARGSVQDGLLVYQNTLLLMNEGDWLSVPCEDEKGNQTYQYYCLFPGNELMEFSLEDRLAQRLR